MNVLEIMGVCFIILITITMSALLIFLLNSLISAGKKKREYFSLLKLEGKLKKERVRYRELLKKFETYFTTKEKAELFFKVIPENEEFNKKNFKQVWESSTNEDDKLKLLIIPQLEKALIKAIDLYEERGKEFSDKISPLKEIEITDYFDYKDRKDLTNIFNRVNKLKSHLKTLFPTIIMENLINKPHLLDVITDYEFMDIWNNINIETKFSFINDKNDKLVDIQKFFAVFMIPRLLNTDTTQPKDEIEKNTISFAKYISLGTEGEGSEEHVTTIKNFIKKKYPNAFIAWKEGRPHCVDLLTTEEFIPFWNNLEFAMKLNILHTSYSNDSLMALLIPLIDKSLIYT